MKYLFILFLISFNLNAQFLLEHDKQLHIGGTYIISSATSSYVLNKTDNRSKALLIGFGVGFTAGLAKEIWDINYGNPSVEDLVADAIGSALGSVVVTIPLQRKRNK